VRNSNSAHSGHRRRVALLVTIVASICGSLVSILGATAHASVSAPVRAGDLIIVEADNPLKELTRGGSATKFTLRLAAEESCPGDSANDQWRIQSFLIPAADDPVALSYGEQGPDGDGRWPLYDLATHPFVHILTLPNTQVGLPGRIDAMPVFSFVLFPPGTLPDGHYRLGIACTYFRETAKYWDTELVLTTSPDDEPGQLDWRLANAPDTAENDNGSGSSTTLWLVLGAGVLGAVALTFILWQRSARRTTPLLKEQHEVSASR
jgi:hypothetical protein